MSDIVFAILLGAFFGFALYIAGASNPSKITEMLRLKYLTLMKIIVFAIGLASILVSITSLLGWFDVSHFNIKSTNLGVIIGGLIFGLGFGWAGTCPGTCVAGSTGKGYKKAIVAIVGGLFGAFCFSVTYGWWDRIGLFQVLNLGKITLFEIIEGNDYLLPGKFVGLLIVGVVFLAFAFLLPKGED